VPIPRRAARWSGRDRQALGLVGLVWLDTGDAEQLVGLLRERHALRKASPPPPARTARPGVRGRAPGERL
jgi:hypothetical protein